MIEEIPNFVIDHLRIHRKAMERNHERKPEGRRKFSFNQPTLLEQIKLFFDVEQETEKQVCRESICTSQKAELGNSALYLH